MKNSIYKLAVITLLLLNSCESFIDLQPLDQISMDDYWKTSSDLKNYTLQFYPIFFPYKNMVDDICRESDDMIHEGISDIMNGTRVLATGNWKNEWRNIRNVNIFFDNYKKCKDPVANYSQYLGEAYFFRAWLYFDLLKKYGDLPWYSEPVDIDSENELMKARDPRTLVADSIIADLDKAAFYLTKRASIGNSKISKEAALAFKTRVALFEGTWQKYHATDVFGTPGADPNKYFQACVNAATELMNGTYKVGIYNTGHPESDYSNLFSFVNMAEINEVLLCRSFNFKDGAGNTVEGYISYNTRQKGVTWGLISSYLGKNGLPYDYTGVAAATKGNAFLTKIAADCDPRLKSTIYIPGDLMGALVAAYFTKPTIDKGALQLCPTGFQVKKTSSPYNQGAAQGWEVGSETGFIILRYGEVLLNYAEAKCELDNSVTLTQLNLLRTRAGMPAFTVNPQGSDLNPVNYGYTITNELYEIRRERRVELALEGIRDEDYMRWAAHTIFKGKRPMGYPFLQSEFPSFTPKLDASGFIDYYKTNMPGGYQFRTNQDYLYSIPQDEITLNPNLVQNPNW